MAQKETTLGNYTSFPRFPLDCESMDYIQNNTKLLAVIAQIAGCDKLIIKGCTGSPRTEGYVYVRTGDDLVGEILYYGGGTGVRCSIATDNIDTTANGETFANAYTKRTLVSGTTGTWAWSEFRALSEITNSALKTLVDGKAAAGHNHTISDIIGLQTILDNKISDIQLSSYVSSDGKIKALRWGNVVTLHINGLKTFNTNTGVYSDRDVVYLPKKFQPTIGETIYGIGFRGFATGLESSQIMLCITNANNEGPSNNILITWYRAPGYNFNYIFATLTYITENT